MRYVSCSAVLATAVRCMCAAVAWGSSAWVRSVWWDEFDLPIQGQYPIPIQGRFQIYHSRLKVTRDADGETVYDYYARVVNAIILELMVFMSFWGWVFDTLNWCIASTQH